MMADLEREIQKKYVTAQLLKQQINAMVEEKSNIDEKLSELAVSAQALESLSELPKGGEMWSSLGGGAFVRSDIKDTENVMVGIGAGIVAKKSRKRASEILKERFEELRKLQLHLMEQVTDYAQRIEDLESDLQQLVEQHEKAQKKGNKK